MKDGRTTNDEPRGDEEFILHHVYNPRGAVALSHEMAMDPRVGLRAKGLYWQMRALAPTFRCTIDRLAGLGPDGERAVATALRQLRAAGWIELYDIQRKNQPPLRAYRVFDHSIPNSSDVLAGQPQDDVLPG